MHIKRALIAMLEGGTVRHNGVRTNDKFSLTEHYDIRQVRVDKLITGEVSEVTHYMDMTSFMSRYSSLNLTWSHVVQPQLEKGAVR